MIADIEKAEKELDFALRKIKQLEDLCRKTRSENETLKSAKKALAEDLQKLVAKRQDIENLQTTLAGILQHSAHKKIDVDELKMKLADSLRREKSSFKVASFDTADSLSLKKKRGKSIDASEGDEEPAWYRTLKKNLK